MDGAQKWRHRLEKSMKAVRQWEQRTSLPDEVEPRSSLDKDDEALPGHPVRSAAWYGLITAVDHLALVADLAKDDLTLRPSSIFTVTRAALLGASQAVWVMTGNREERQLRALSVASDEYKNHRGFVNDYVKDAFIKERSEDIIADLENLAQRLTDKMQSLRPLRQGKPYAGDFSSTTMMREAAIHLASQPDTDDWLRLGLGYEWRMASAAAHARAWPMHVRTTEREPLAGGGEIRRMAASLPEIVQSYGAAVLMTSEAWNLWDLRRIRHV